MIMTPSPENIRADYKRDGYLIAPALWSTDECAMLKAEALRVVAAHGRPNLLC